MTQILVVYPSGPSFDLDYYLKTHMPLVASTWGSQGLLGWDVLTFPADAPFQVQATLRWTNIESFKAATATETAKAVFEDIKKFTTAQPILLTGTVVASS